ncbi:hypothetical protein [Singulisphaera sp. PoT]|uniref:hypothetical protein n=1 Tax=Singulisphaera sp. PoT TaxID=3411797 RepID=UPI003BF5CFF1
MFLKRDQILSAPDLAHEIVEVPEWGGKVMVRCMTGAEREKFEASYLELGMKEFRARLAAATICDENLNRIFTYEDIELLQTKSALALERVMNVSLRLSKLRKQDMEQAEGNSGASPSADSSSSSPTVGDAPSASSSSESLPTS